MNVVPTLPDSGYEPELWQTYASGDQHATFQLECGLEPTLDDLLHSSLDGHEFDVAGSISSCPDDRIHPTPSHSCHSQPPVRPDIPISSYSYPHYDGPSGTTQYPPSSTDSSLPDMYGGDPPPFSPIHDNVTEPQTVLNEPERFTDESLQGIDHYPYGYPEPGTRSDPANDLIPTPCDSLLYVTPTTPAEALSNTVGTAHEVCSRVEELVQIPYTNGNTARSPLVGEVLDFGTSGCKVDLLLARSSATTRTTTSVSAR
ncbi:hypothetical protein C8Q80DRAFT_417621 [Daedaleopsis nitida]|nr:hypothetical protein C8Q80DRAFT_417621 [Daedaleopsis nitida]